ncbi:hypothetical protein Forpi1262_v007119 [Fusarium oxysporum f. sp. raphani]|uniref:PKD domain-containing protein n=1 Tax=Fusarium oxysporum f. sp. raphani TaxID=96318 RepID=A0A8J5UFB5_FUSOX|nr:hypothetical protein Forpi1262_v007119 [Fusarium oxysporum f. sp. raphani]
MLPTATKRIWYWIGAAAVFATSVESLISPIILKGPKCQEKDGGVVQVTADCVDGAFNTVVIDAQTDIDTPVPHHRVSGHFNGSKIDFNIYLPKTDWDGRFFQLVYPLQNSTAEDAEIGFGADSGGYTNRVAGGGGYRADAAVAKLSRTIAEEYYGKLGEKIYGYIYGASGGSFVTAGAIENTFDVWQGAIPIVQAIPISNPNNFCLRALAGLTLGPQKDKLIDSVRPGGDMDPFSCLDTIGREGLKEVTELGIPLEAFEDFEGIAGNRTSFLQSFRTMVIPTIESFDPTYFNDFWTKKGYLGTEKSKLGDFYRESLYEYDTTVRAVSVGAGNVPVAITLNEVSPTPPEFGIQLTVKSKDGKSSLGRFTAQLDMRLKTATIDAAQNATVLALLSKGTKVHVDNRAWLAASLYHRHQVPTREGFSAWDYLRNADGQPKYPQRKVLIGDTISFGASGGCSFTGNVTAHVMVMDALKDFDALPWQATWYKAQVQKALGDRFNDKYRLHYIANADHFIDPQHLRDLSAWVEKGKEPPAGTSYTVSHGQVKVPATAAQRRSIQPVVDLTANGKDRVTIKAGRSVSFSAHIEVPPNTGSVTSVEWDFEGNGNFVKKSFGKAKGIMDVAASRTYRNKGTYYPSVRVASHRDGDAKSAYAQVANLGRMRVIVD